LALVVLALVVLAVSLLPAAVPLAGLAGFVDTAGALEAAGFVALACFAGGVVAAPARALRASRMASGRTLSTFGMALTNNEFFKY
jgi:hypothetical protein